VWLIWLIDRLGRTKLLMFGALGGSLCMWYIAAYIKIADPAGNPNPSGKLSSGGISAVFFFYLWTAFYTPSWNGTPWVINSEMYSQQTRSLGQAFAAGKHILFLHTSNSTLTKNSQQLVVQLHYFTIHTSDVQHHGLRGVHVLRKPHVAFHPLRVSIHVI
jgi:hypothetical protein